MSATVLTLPGVETGPWQVRNRFDPAAVALADRHYPRRPGKIGSNQLGGVGRALVCLKFRVDHFYPTLAYYPNKS